MEKNSSRENGPKKRFDPAVQLKKAQVLKDKLLAQVGEIDLDTNDFAKRKENISKIYKLSQGMFAANISGDRDVEFTVSSTSKIKELIESSQKIAKIMDYFIDSIAYFTKKGNTDKAMDLIKEQALLQDTIDLTTKALDVVSVEYLKKGIGSKSALDDFAKKDKALKQEEIKSLYKTGMPCSEIATKLVVDIEYIKPLVAPFRAEYLEARKDEIKKAIIKKEDLLELAMRLEIKNKVLKATLNTWAVNDEKLEKALSLITAAQPVKEEEIKEAV